MAGLQPNAIDITQPTRFSSSSPRNQSSNLTSALQQAGNTTPHPPMDIARKNVDNGRPIFGRQESLGFGLGSSLSGARPILSASKRKDSMANGSYMGGMSWGGMSVGSFLQDDIMMTGTSPYNLQSPSYHSSSYLPKMEANFWNNLRCCDTGFSDLHELLQHFEEVHSQAPSAFPYRMSQPGNERLSRRKSSNLGNVLSQGEQTRSNNQSMLGYRGGQNAYEGPAKSPLSPVPDLETIGDMDMDDETMQPIGNDLSMFQQQSDAFSNAVSSNMSALSSGLGNGAHDQQNFQSSNQTTPKPNNHMFVRQSNLMGGSSANAPTLGTQQSMNSSNGGGSGALDEPETGFGNGPFTTSNLPFNAQMLQGLSSDFGNLDFSNGNDMLDLCIDDPAKALFSEQGGINAQQFPHFSFLNGASSTADEATRRLQAATLLGKNRLPGEEERPFKCPVIGCEKAYKNANGLRYHEKHGHSTQKLKENGDGTFSIVDPETSIPYPGTVGMEKEKPYRCEVCGKRYKNLNGLKYHRNHSPPCNPDFNFNNVALPAVIPGEEIIY